MLFIEVYRIIRALTHTMIFIYVEIRFVPNMNIMQLTLTITLYYTIFLIRL